MGQGLGIEPCLKSKKLVHVNRGEISTLLKIRANMHHEIMT